MRVRDKRGLDIEAGDTLVAGCEDGKINFIEVTDIVSNLGAVLGTDADGVHYTIADPFNYVSVCACYRDAKAQS